ncbi:CYTIDYLATE KINASE/PANTOATE-BETA-ALANINE LIGASE [Salix purpurea]|uniref:Pantoate--beta-alanine ligase n=1 Tax=Salix purpurea TaxID=77065 RepID=A0A9Q0PF38_SALPP|nr:CYTIDYLATE KINASE/PANTOATE-BETA-ALANINE LIGASE [Salix purpurea]
MEASKKEPLLITDKEQMRKWSRAMRSQGKSISLVPTMGYLHQGHISLVREALKLTNLTVVSIYVNPGQFAPSEDLSTYPSDFHGDISKLMSVPGGVDVVFHPPNLYDYENDMKRNKNDQGVCKEFRGAGLCSLEGLLLLSLNCLTLSSLMLLSFGKKDYQQWRIVQRMVRDLDFSIRIIGAEILRDNDGLAMSSRNVHLSAEERGKALSISRSLLGVKSAAENGHINCRELRDSVIQAVSEAGGRIDYAEIVDQESLQAVEEINSPVVFCIAAWFGKVRLIDNIEINL